MAKYDAIIIGSGFGGCIVASQLIAKWTGKTPKRRILILERGSWWVTPDTLGVPAPKPPNGQSLPEYLAAQHEPVQYWPRPDHSKGLLYLFATMRTALNPKGLYHYFTSEEAHILAASGVGGGSLIYSGVNIQPDQSIYQGWPIPLDDPAYQAARQWMETYRGKLSQIVTKIPVTKETLAKWSQATGQSVTLNNLTGHEYLYLDRARALKEAASGVAQKQGTPLPWGPLDLSITEFDGDDDPAGSIKQHTHCERQGRCILGCLPAARHTLNKTVYGKLFQQQGVDVELWSLAEARSIAPDSSGGYEVSLETHGDKQRPATVSAGQVFLTAGCLGTNELLLRCQQDTKSLKLSDLVGHGFSTNGDFAAFVVGTTHPVHSGRGPINMCHVRWSYQDGSRRRPITVEDAGIPKLFAAYARSGLDVLDSNFKRELFKGRMVAAWLGQVLPDLGNLIPSIPDTDDPTSYRTEDAMLADVFFFNAMGMDDANGIFDLDRRGKLTLRWDTPVADHITFQKTEEILRSLAAEMGGNYVPFPLWKGFSNKKLVVTHPLGGCRIGTDRSEGVVNENGEVFDASQQNAKATYKGLYVVDGSIVPNALAVNPTLTITALALKIMSQVQ